MVELLSRRAQSLLNTLFVVFATLLLGDALHQTVVTGALPATSPAIVARVVAGAAFGVAGYLTRLPREGRFEESPEEAADPDEDAPERAGEGFDPEMSPLTEESLENLEEREEREGADPDE
jgi:hypothetical protein